jgi:hypothetical protein
VPGTTLKKNAAQTETILRNERFFLERADDRRKTLVQPLVGLGHEPRVLFGAGFNEFYSYSVP